MSQQTPPSHNDDAKPALGMDASVLQAIGELLAAAASILDADSIRRLGGPGLYRRRASILAAFLTFSIVLRVRQRASIEGHRVVQTISLAQRYLSHPPTGWAAA